MLLYDGVI